MRFRGIQVLKQDEFQKLIMTDFDDGLGTV